MGDGQEGLIHPWRDDDRNAQVSHLYGVPGAVSPRLDDDSAAAFATLARAAETSDRQQISHALDAVLAMTRSRRTGVKYLLRLSLWCAMTSLERRRVLGDDALPLAERIFDRVSIVVTPSVEVVAGVLRDATQPTSDNYSLPEAEFMLIAAVALAQLGRIGPASGSDLQVWQEFAWRHCTAPDPALVEEDWLSKLGSRS